MPKGAFLPSDFTATKFSTVGDNAFRRDDYREDADGLQMPVRNCDPIRCHAMLGKIAPPVTGDKRDICPLVVSLWE
jgi:hypothetical protein